MVAIRSSDVRSWPNNEIALSICVVEVRNVWHCSDMRTASKRICEGSGKTSLLSHVDEPDGRGICGVCRQAVQFKLLNGVMVPIEHFKAAKLNHRKRLPPAAKSLNPGSGRNPSLS